MEHKVEDLIAAVRVIPPSDAKVITRFLGALMQGPIVNGYVEDERVLTIVNEWPNACPEGKKAFLKSVGIEEKPTKTVHLMGYTRLKRNGTPLDFHGRSACFRPFLASYGLTSNLKGEAKDLTCTWDGKTPLPLIGVGIQDPIHPWHEYVFTAISVQDSPNA